MLSGAISLDYMGSPNAYGTRDMIYVDLTATLVDSTGTRLWRSAGRCHIESRAIRGDVNLPEPSPGVRTERVSAPAGSPGASASGGTNAPGASSGGNLSGGGGTGFFKDKLVRDGLRQTPMPSPPSVAESEEAAVPPDFRAAVDSLLAAWVPRFPTRPRPADPR